MKLDEVHGHTHRNKNSCDKLEITNEEKEEGVLVHQRMTMSNHCDVAQITLSYSGTDVARKDREVLM